MQEAAVLLAHGSHLDSEPSRIVESLASEVQRRTGFTEVGTAYVDEEPHLEDALSTVDSEIAVGVPLFTADGYYVNEVLPNELPDEVQVTPPVGTHRAFDDVVLERAVDVSEWFDVSIEETALVVVGHGTPRHSDSGGTVRRTVDHLRRDSDFTEVEPFFLDQSPNVGDMTDGVEAEAAVVVPYFVADGPHATEDVPEAIGFTETPVDPPQQEAVDGVELTYTSAAFTHPATADVVVERVEDAPEPQEVTGA